MRLSAPLLSCVALVAASLPAQVSWTNRSNNPNQRSDHAMAYDTTRDVTVLFGGRIGSRPADDLWQRRGVVWSRVAITAGAVPRARAGHAMAFDAAPAEQDGDAARGVTVLFGGRGSSETLTDTWEWNGSAWALAATSTSPSARTDHAMAYDSARNVTVLFGGGDGSGINGETWEYDGTDWRQRTATPSPPARRHHAMAYDAVRGVTVMFGGQDASSQELHDTWEWDGTEWRRADLGGAPARRHHTMSFDASLGVVLLVGGRLSTSISPGDTWQWNGVDWRPLSPPTPIGRAEHAAMVYDPGRGRTVLFGGTNTIHETWEFDGVDWTAANPPPSGRDGPAMVFDVARGEVLLFGGGLFLADTWSWNGTHWTKLNSTTSPPGRYGAGLAYDEARQRAVLFGGKQQSAVANDTWEWDGTDWIARTPAASPSPRTGAGLAYDAARDETVLFGGITTGSIGLRDTWVWDGTTWTERFPFTVPFSGGNPDRMMTYDAARQRIVLRESTRTWEWDGSDWSQASASGPPWSSHVSLAYDAARQRVVHYGGTQTSGPTRDTWEWDGSTWTQRAPRRSPPARYDFGVAYDRVRREVVVFGGRPVGFGNPLDETWTYAPDEPAGVVAFGSGCGPHALTADDLPWLGATLHLRLSGLAPGQPAVVFVGASRSAWGALPLPLGLDPAGMPGCTLLASPDAALPQTTPGTWELPIPTPASLLGLSIYHQGLVVSPGSNPADVLASNALEARIGRR